MPAYDVIEVDPIPRRAAQLEELIEHCAAARIIAEAQGEKFLSYMLAMTIQAASGLKRERASR